MLIKAPDLAKWYYEKVLLLIKAFLHLNIVIMLGELKGVLSKASITYSISDDDTGYPDT